MENATPTTDREHWFAALPAKTDPLGRFYGHGNWAPHGYYQGKSYETFNFTGANLLRKYGDDWNGRLPPMVHVRLRSWGMNTIANWSDASVACSARRPTWPRSTSAAASLEGSEGYWGKFSDAFDPSFAAVGPQGDGRRSAHGRSAIRGAWAISSATN